jgi:ATP-dependent Clp protease ATP-binding subunit ClpA
MTSNIGSRGIGDFLKGKARIGFDCGNSGNKEADKDKDGMIYEIATEKLKDFFSTEFLGRILDNIIVFRPLKEKEISDIIDLKITELQNEIIAVYPIILSIDKGVREFLLKESVDHPEYGARPINDKIKKYLRVPLSKLINSKQIQVNDHIFVKMKKDKPIFMKKLDNLLKN